eukprot:TRINITY_DN25136_c0_g1_i1.p1 TRINITY_DN25136_c0_g1~~TRINITY_DN25136_c0_g1_i1.p1  ORF type:complete len:552 (-),score=147.99 TRINITY_DN25136_c0_g1_i1:182-1837(-)
MATWERRRCNCHAALRFVLLLASCAHLAWTEVDGQAPVASNDFMCQCEFKDNNWVHQFAAILRHVQELPTILQHPEHPASQWIAAQRCDEDASVFPNTDTLLDIQDVLHVRRAAVMPASGGRLEVHHFCFPGQTAMAMICAQQYLVKRSLRGVLKWIEKMAEILSIVKDCMDAESPLPLRFRDFEAYLQRFQGSIPTQENPAFVQHLAWTANAALKTYVEATEPLHECLPLKDPECFPRHTVNLFESCSECCHPSKGPNGNPECWVGPYTYQRCCRQSPRPFKVEASQPAQCLGQDEKNAELAKALQAEVKTSQELGRAKNFLTEDLKRAQETAEELKKKVQTQDGELATVRAAHNALEVAANASREEVERLRTELRGGSSEALRLEQELQAAREASDAALELRAQELERLRAEAERLEQELLQARGENDDLERLLKESQVESAGLREELRNHSEVSERLEMELQQARESAAGASSAAADASMAGVEGSGSGPAPAYDEGGEASAGCQDASGSSSLNASIRGALEEHRRVQLCPGYLTFVSNCAFNDMGAR